MSWWDELNTPDDYRDDWYGEFKNQLAHTFLGVMLAVVWCLLAYFVIGEMPVRALMIAVIVVCYLAIEIVVQGWKAGDSWFDAAMVTCGAGGLLVGLQETGVSDGLVMLAFDPVALSAVVVPWSIALFLRVLKRYVAG